MKWINARRRHPLAGYVVVLLALAFVGVGYAFVAPTTGNAQAQTLAADSAGQEASKAENKPDAAKGKEIYTKNCSSCHGTNFQGGTTDKGEEIPALTDVGAAAIDFQVSTGRMPSMDPESQMPRKPPAFSQDEIDDLVAYYEQEGTSGPGVPTDIPGTEPARGDFSDEKEYEAAKEKYDEEKEQYLAGGNTSGEDTEAGMKLYMANCAHCHSWSGGGGALTGGDSAPEIRDASPRQLYEAMVTGPSKMPVFNDTTMAPDEKQKLISYVEELQGEPNPGGVFDLGRIGTVSEGFIGWTVGISLIVACAIWITAKQRAHD